MSGFNQVGKLKSKHSVYVCVCVCGQSVGNEAKEVMYMCDQIIGGTIYSDGF